MATTDEVAAFKRAVDTLARQAPRSMATWAFMLDKAVTGPVGDEFVDRLLDLLKAQGLGNVREARREGGTHGYQRGYDAGYNAGLGVTDPTNNTSEEDNSNDQ